MLLIAIPVALLWRLRISLRQKMILMFVLGLSIFTIIVCIVRIAGARYPNGLIDSAWMVFWLQLEASVAVVIISLTSYRSLFVKDKPTDKKSPKNHSTSYKRKLWSREKREQKGVEMPTLPNPTLTGMRTVIGRTRGYDDGYSRSEDFFLPSTTKGIVVTREADVRTDGRLPNVGADYSRIPRLRRHTWSPEEKQVLYILSSHFNNPSTELWKVFNAHFKERRRRWLGPRKSAWETMRVWNMNPLRYRVWWTGSVSRRVCTELMRTALSVGVQLLPNYDVIPSTPVRRSRKGHGSSSVSTVEDGLDSLQSTSQERSTARRKLFDAYSAPGAKEATLTNGLLTPPPTAKKARTWKSRIQTATAVPSIAFRGMSQSLYDILQLMQKSVTNLVQAFNQHSQGINGPDGFVAGKFVNSISIPDPPNEKEYLYELWRHLEKYHSGPTPFISVSPYLMRVIMHAYRRDRELGEEKSEWNVAVIALSKVTSSVKAVWELDWEFIDKNGYNGKRAFGEWVVHGSIPASNVLSIIPLSRLVETMSSARPPFHIDKLIAAKNLGKAREAMASSIKRLLNYNDGLAIGKVLLCLGIPKRYLDELTSAILHDWRFPEGPYQERKRKFCPERDNEKWKLNGGFIRGRNEGFASEIGEWRELREDEEECGPDGDGTYDTAMWKPSESTTSYGFNWDATPQAPAVDVGCTPFCGFLMELEEVAFGSSQLDGFLRCGSAIGCSEEDLNVRLKEESPDCLALDSMHEC
ncbi:MAG: hypothetical protein Q9226_006694 [Calogaya cf. arnoldii]